MRILNKEEAIEYCYKWGKFFIYLFQEYFETNELDKKDLIVKNMQNLLDDINNIKLTYNDKKLYHLNKMDWFFTATSSYDTYFADEDLIEKYDKFVLLIETNQNVKKSFEIVNEIKN